MGAVARYWLSGAVYQLADIRFPYGTLVVNVLGCLFIGFLMAAFEDRFLINPSLRIFLLIGILGGFTTYSSFSYETISMLRDGEAMLAFLNIASSLLLCLGGTFVGALLGRML